MPGHNTYQYLNIRYTIHVDYAYYVSKLYLRMLSYYITYIHFNSQCITIIKYTHIHINK